MGILKLGLGALAAAALTLATAALPSTAAAQDKPSIIMMSGGFTDGFFGTIKTGGEQAAAQFGVDFQYLTISDHSDVMGNYIRLLEQIISRKPSAIITNDFFPDSFDPMVQEAAAQGIPVIYMSDGINSWQNVGAIAFVGQDPYHTGEVAGQRFVAKGAKHVLCLNHVPGNPSLETTCNGLKDVLTRAGATMQVLNIPIEQSQNPTAIVQAIEGVLQASPDIDAIYTFGPDKAVQAGTAMDEIGLTGKIMLGTSNLSSATLQMLQDGKLDFTLDGQPYLQGFYTVMIAAQYLKYGMLPGANMITGPVVVDKESLGNLAQINSEYPGIRGAL